MTRVQQSKPDIGAIKALFARSGNKCAYPDCSNPLVDEDTGVTLGEVCHISATSKGGPRYDPSIPDSNRQSIANLVILCPTHHSLIDKAPDKFSAARIRQFKDQHEAKVAVAVNARKSLSDARAASFVRQLQTESVDFAIVVALPKELAAVRRHFPELKREDVTATRTRVYYSAEIRISDGTRYRVIATSLTSMGNLESTQAAADVIRDWNPRFIIVTGIAGGLDKQNQSFGDVVVSESIVYYEPGKLRDRGIEQRHKHFPSDRALLASALQLDDTGWRFRLPERPDMAPANEKVPSVHFGTLASGEKVLASQLEVTRLRDLHRNLKAVEMESAGVASAALSAATKIGFVAIRSICDFADAKKGDHWQPYAAEVAASYTRALIDSRPIAPSEGAWPKSGDTPPSALNAIDHRKKLHDHICRAVDLEEFKNFCFFLGVDYDELPGDRKSAKVRELILWFERHRIIPTLVAASDELNVPQ